MYNVVLKDVILVTNTYAFIQKFLIYSYIEFKGIKIEILKDDFLQMTDIYELQWDDKVILCLQYHMWTTETSKLKLAKLSVIFTSDKIFDLY